MIRFTLLRESQTDFGKESLKVLDIMLLVLPIAFFRMISQGLANRGGKIFAL